MFPIHFVQLSHSQLPKIYPLSTPLTFYYENVRACSNTITMVSSHTYIAIILHGAVVIRAYTDTLPTYTRH